MRLKMVETCSLKQAHHVQQIIQTEMEKRGNIERFFVHCECDGCYNEFGDNVEAREPRAWDFYYIFVVSRCMFIIWTTNSKIYVY